MLRASTLGLLATLVASASADIVITEWMYNGSGSGNTGEFVEFTNIGLDPIDMTGWSFDDDSRIPGAISLSAFGIVQPGQSVILTDESAASFAANWGLTGIAIIGGNTANLGRNDEINLFNAAGNLVDRLTYGDEAFPGTVRTQNRSCNIPAADYGYTTVQTTWLLAVDGDEYGSKVSARGEIGGPGRIVGFAGSDFDRDGDVDQADFEVLSCCYTGPDVPYDPPPIGCPLNPDTQGRIAADLDEDGDVDLADFTIFQLCFSGQDIPADPACGQGSSSPGITHIILNGNSITVIGSGVTVNGAKAVITASGSYEIIGTLSDGQIVVNSSDGGLVKITLKGVHISNSTNAPFFISSAGFVEIVLADQSQNYLVDASTYIYENPNDDEPNASLFSKDSMMISGSGSLTVYGNYNDAITSKDELIITGGTINVIAVDDGIRGKDWLLIQGGNFNVTSGGDGLKSDNADGPGVGYVAIENGTFHITSGGDGIAAQTEVEIADGNFTIVSGGGHTVTITTDLSAKGIKGLAGVAIGGGTFNLDCADDGVHSNDVVTISGGILTIATNNDITAGYGDGIHADNLVHIINGAVTITSSYEGIEGANITIENGVINITSSNDAIDAENNIVINGGTFTILSGGGHTVTIPSTRSAKALKGLNSVTIGGGTFNIDAADDGVHSNNAVLISGGDLTIATNSSTSASYGDGVHADLSFRMTGGSINVTTAYEGIESRDITIDNGTIRVNTTDDGINAAGGTGLNNYIRINGGYIAVYAAGDGIDSNGHIIMTGGTVIVHGPTVNNNAAIDYDGTFNISGGFLVAVGSSGMAQAPSTTSTQRSVKITYNSNHAANTLIHIRTVSGGTNVLTFAPSKVYRSAVISCPAFTAGAQFYLYSGGSSTGIPTDGLYQGGAYTPGTQTNTFTTNSIVTNISAP